MNKSKLVFLFNLVFSLSVFGQTDVNMPSFSEGKPLVDVSGQWFLGHQTFLKDGAYNNLFTLKRGYLTFKKDFNETFSVRFTQDITLDQEGGDSGNIEMRLKYLYLKINLKTLPLLTHSYLEVGMVHRPWLDFEEHLNDYRVQGPMYLETFKVLNSADFGLNLVTLLGGKIDADYQKKVSNSYPGKYGSWSIGVFNGGGYHAQEYNNNKTLETRLSLRPFPEFLPGFQVSYHGAFGKGNEPTSPAYYLNHAYVSFESRRLILAAQAQQGLGNSFGSFLHDDLTAYRHRGFSLFGELYLYRKNLSVLANWSNFNQDISGWKSTQELMGGVCYHFLNDQKFLLDIERYQVDNLVTYMFEAAVEIRF